MCSCLVGGLPFLFHYKSVVALHEDFLFLYECVVVVLQEDFLFLYECVVVVLQEDFLFLYECVVVVLQVTEGLPVPL